MFNLLGTFRPYNILSEPDWATYLFAVSLQLAFDFTAMLLLECGKDSNLFCTVPQMIPTFVLQKITTVDELLHVLTLFEGDNAN